MTTIFENDFIKVERGYDFLCKIRNKTSRRICIHYNEPKFNDNYDSILIEPNDWVGIRDDDEGRDWEKAIKRNWFYIVTDNDENDCYPTGCSMTQWNEDCEEITNEVERILNEYNLYDHDRDTNVANSNQLVTVLEILKNIR